MMGFSFKNITKERFIVIVIFLMLMWIGIMLFLYFKADEITKHPCQICAKRMSQDVICYLKGTGVSRSYFPNFTVITSGDEDVGADFLQGG
jgi:hypothetical protein